MTTDPREAYEQYAGLSESDARRRQIGLGEEVVGALGFISAVPAPTLRAAVATAPAVQKCLRSWRSFLGINAPTTSLLYLPESRKTRALEAGEVRMTAGVLPYFKRSGLFEKWK